MVTEQPQYSVVVCIFSTSQNTEISLIPNGLRLIYTCSLLLALPCIFHGLRHTFATRCIESQCDYKTVSVILGHSNVATTLNLYVHPNLNQKKRCIDRMSNFLGITWVSLGLYIHGGQKMSSMYVMRMIDVIITSFLSIQLFYLLRWCFA